MAINWYGNQSSAESRNFGPLAIIAPLLERMKLAEVIEAHIPTDPQADFKHGDLLSLLVAARLSNPVALSKVGKWAEMSGADILWDIPAKALNDDRLGRSLDAFFQQRHSILAHLALAVSREFKVSLREIHYDPTHILFHGAYEDAQPRSAPVIEGEQVRSNDQLDAAHITKGRATDDAPDGALMVHAGLCTIVDEFGPLPIFGHTVDGNQNGHTAVAQQFALMQKHLRPKKLTMFSDRGTYSAGMLRRLWKEGFHAVCSAPWKDYRDLFQQNRKRLVWKKASFLSLEQKRRRTSGNLPQEHYELAVLKHEFIDPDDKKAKPIPGRVIFVFSTADQKVVRQQRQKQITKLTEGLTKLQQSVANGNRSTDPASINRRIAKVFGKKDAAKYFTYEMVPLTAAERQRLPKPKPGSGKVTHRLEFRFDQQAVLRDEECDGYAALVTTVPLSEGSADVLFTKFKEQIYCEQVNHQFKTPLAISPIFLHSPHRVEALIFLMMISLTAYYLVQRLYRQSVPEDAPPAEQRMTTETLLSAFNNYTLLVHHEKHGHEIQPTRLTARQREILQRLGFATPAQMLSHRLPRAPT